MSIPRHRLLLYAVTVSGSPYLHEQVEAALQGGATLIQLREKELSPEALLQEAREITGLCHRYGVPLIVNDFVDVALESGADGVHVGMEDAPVAEIRRRVPKDFIIGATAKTVSQALAAKEAGADYLGVGAVFPSPTKEKAIRITPQELEAVCRATDLPAVAIGGITRENMEELRGRGMDGFAVVSAVFGQEDVCAAARDLVQTARKVLGKRPAVLSVAGSDSSGGAGIQADLKTMLANGVYGMTALTALTAQNTRGVRAVSEVSPEFLQSQLDAVFEDIPPDAVKTGMIPTPELISAAAERLRFHHARNIVVDPVMVATSGSRLMKTEAVETLCRELLPLSVLATPNIPEAEVLSGQSIRSKADMESAAGRIMETCGCAVLVKGGHGGQDASDLLFDGQCRWIPGERLPNPNTHGTGCTLSSAIAAGLAKGLPLLPAVEEAKAYVAGAIAAGLNMGEGSGPLDHGYGII